MTQRTPWRPFFTFLPRKVRVIVDPNALDLWNWSGEGPYHAMLEWIERRIGEDGRPEYAVRGRVSTDEETEEQFLARQW